MSLLFNELLLRYRDLNFDIIPDDETSEVLITGFWSLYLFLRDQIFKERVVDPSSSELLLLRRGELVPIHNELRGATSKVFPSIVRSHLRLSSQAAKGCLESIFAKAALAGVYLKEVYHQFYNLNTEQLEDILVFDSKSRDRARDLAFKDSLVPTNFFKFKFGFFYSQNPSVWLPYPVGGSKVSFIPMVRRFLRANTPAEVWYDFSFLIGEPLPRIDLIKSRFNSLKQLDYIEFPEELSTSYALKFDGIDDYANCGNDSSLRPQDLTIELRVKPAVVDENMYGIIVNGGQWGGFSYGWRIWQGGSRMSKRLGIQMNFGDPGPRSIDDWDALSEGANVWYQIAVTYDHHYLRLYVNGVEKGRLAETRDINYSSEDLLIGRAQWFYNGEIAEVRIHNRALDPTEIAYNCLHSTPYSTESLVLWLRLKEGSGTIAYDASGHDNNATLSGATWVQESLPWLARTHFKLQVPTLKAVEFDEHLLLKGPASVETSTGVELVRVAIRPTPAPAESSAESAMG